MIAHLSKFIVTGLSWFFFSMCSSKVKKFFFFLSTETELSLCI